MLAKDLEDAPRKDFENGQGTNFLSFNWLNRLREKQTTDTGQAYTTASVVLTLCVSMIGP